MDLLAIQTPSNRGPHCGNIPSRAEAGSWPPPLQISLLPENDDIEIRIKMMLNHHLEVVLELVNDGGGVLRPSLVVECHQPEEARVVAMIDILDELGEVIPEHLQCLRRHILAWRRQKRCQSSLCVPRLIPGVAHLVQLVGDGCHDAKEAHGARGGPEHLRVHDDNLLALAVHILQRDDPDGPITAINPQSSANQSSPVRDGLVTNAPSVTGAHGHAPDAHVVHDGVGGHGPDNQS